MERTSPRAALRRQSVMTIPLEQIAKFERMSQLRSILHLRMPLQHDALCQLREGPTRPVLSKSLAKQAAEADRELPKLAKPPVLQVVSRLVVPSSC